MPQLEIRIFGDPVLRQRAHEVTEFDDRLRRLADDMLQTMRAANGAGLAANQVGVLKRLFTWETDAGHGAVINPTITFESDEIQEGDEGCLSFPGLFYPTKRPLQVHIDAQDVTGEDFTLEGEGLLARIIAHEIDHLNGILFIEHLARHDRKEAMRRIRRGELENPPLPEVDPVDVHVPDDAHAGQAPLLDGEGAGEGHAHDHHHDHDHAHDRAPASGSSGPRR